MAREWLLAERIAKKLTMKQMAERMGITESYYCNIENGTRKKNMDILTCCMLSKILGIPLAVVCENETRYAGQ